MRAPGRPSAPGPLPCPPPRRTCTTSPRARARRGLGGASGKSTEQERPPNGGIPATANPGDLGAQDGTRSPSRRRARAGLQQASVVRPPRTKACTARRQPHDHRELRSRRGCPPLAAITWSCGGRCCVQVSSTRRMREHTRGVPSERGATLREKICRIRVRPIELRARIIEYWRSRPPGDTLMSRPRTSYLRACKLLALVAVGVVATLALPGAALADPSCAVQACGLRHGARRRHADPGRTGPTGSRRLHRGCSRSPRRKLRRRTSPYARDAHRAVPANPRLHVHRRTPAT